MRGQITATMLLYTVKFGIVALVIFLLKGLAPYVMILHVDTHEVEARMFVQQLLVSPAGLVQDKEGYVHIGVIDPAKLNSLDNRMQFDKALAARVVLTNLTGGSIAEGFFQKEWYRLWSVLLGKRGAGGTVNYQLTNYVLFETGNGALPGRLTVDVVMPRG
ncbi:hypothetical protein HY639_05055 [Candidatus Woesearchaeota archaeon]|nr:hypothetical protein [Candidatus Woesearchaeota archaeon]